ncbi:MAG TPA: hypothetical protein VGI30_06850, partial [Caulobacteraceae bacterium]
VDFGPEGGDGGGRIISTGTPETVATDTSSWTGRYLSQLLARQAERTAAQAPAKRTKVSA